MATKKKRTEIEWVRFFFAHDPRFRPCTACIRVQVSKIVSAIKLRTTDDEKTVSFPPGDAFRYLFLHTFKNFSVCCFCTIVFDRDPYNRSGRGSYERFQVSCFVHLCIFTTKLSVFPPRFAVIVSTTMIFSNAEEFY